MRGGRGLCAHRRRRSRSSRSLTLEPTCAVRCRCLAFAAAQLALAASFPSPSSRTALPASSNPSLAELPSQEAPRRAAGWLCTVGGAVANPRRPLPPAAPLAVPVRHADPYDRTANAELKRCGVSAAGHGLRGADGCGPATPPPPAAAALVRLDAADALHRQQAPQPASSRAVGSLRERSGTSGGAGEGADLSLRHSEVMSRGQAAEVAVKPTGKRSCVGSCRQRPQRSAVSQACQAWRQATAAAAAASSRCAPLPTPAAPRSR